MNQLLIKKVLKKFPNLKSNKNQSTGILLYYNAISDKPLMIRRSSNIWKCIYNDFLHPKKEPKLNLQHLGIKIIHTSNNIFYEIIANKYFNLDDVVNINLNLFKIDKKIRNKLHYAIKTKDIDFIQENKSFSHINFEHAINILTEELTEKDKKHLMPHITNIVKKDKTVNNNQMISIIKLDEIKKIKYITKITSIIDNSTNLSEYDYVSLKKISNKISKNNIIAVREDLFLERKFINSQKKSN